MASTTHTNVHACSGLSTCSPPDSLPNRATSYTAAVGGLATSPARASSGLGSISYGDSCAGERWFLQRRQAASPTVAPVRVSGGSCRGGGRLHLRRFWGFPWGFSPLKDIQLCGSDGVYFHGWWLSSASVSGSLVVPVGSDIHMRMRSTRCWDPALSPYPTMHTT